VRFSDKISNLKFHRNFTILGSKLIVLSTGTFNPPPPSPLPPPPLHPAFHLAPNPAEGTLKISSLLLITRHAYRRGLRGIPMGLFGGAARVRNDFDFNI